MSYFMKSVIYLVLIDIVITLASLLADEIFLEISSNISSTCQHNNLY